MRSTVLCLIAAFVLCGAGHAAQTVVNAYYQADVPFPQFDWIWLGNAAPGTAKPSTRLGGTLRVYVRNTTKRTLDIADVQMQGVSLTKAVAYSDQRKFKHQVYAAGVYFSKLPKDQIKKVISAGEPIWWRFLPKTIKPGAYGELIVRLRRTPAGGAVKLLIVAKSGDKTEVSIPVARKVPRFQAICFTPARDMVHLYAEHPRSRMKPSGISMDGVDITSASAIFYDSSMKLVPVICKLKAPVAMGSLHYFQATYPDGSKATSSVRAFDSTFAFGMWGARPGEAENKELAIFHLKDLAAHNINVLMEMVGSAAVAEYIKTDEGHAMMASLGITRMIYEPGKGRTKNPWGYFLVDEPDTADYKVIGTPHESKVGSISHDLVRYQEQLHAVDPVTPGLLNMDYTFKPYHWYIYGQVPDILASDPYYQARIGQEAEYGKAPEKIRCYKKATYIEGVTAICQSSHAPKPVHLVLLAGGGRRDDTVKGPTFAPWQEKRIETYYSIGAGAKGISYWWFYGLEKGLPPNAADAAAVAQWSEMGLMGAELRTAGPVLTTACPVSLPIAAPKELWARTLLRGNDTVVLVCVNDDYSCDLQGINIKPLTDVRVGVRLPSWLTPKSVFEVSGKGTSDVTSEQAGGKLNLQLGTVDVTRLIVITSDTSLRSRMQQFYDSKFKANVEKLMGG